MLRLVLAALLALPPLAAARADLAPPRLRLPASGALKRPAASLRRVVGELSEAGAARCLAGGEVEWVGRHPVVGFTPLVPAAGVELAPHYGQLVVVEGAVIPRGLPPAGPVRHEGPCLEVQRRSDWIDSPRGMRVQRAGMGPVAPAFAVTHVRAWSGLATRADGEVLEVALTNTFGEPLTGVTLRVHYEGCHGKPGTTTRALGGRTLAPGETLRFEAPLVARETDRPDGREIFAASSVQVEARGATVAFDLDRSLSRAGVAAPCPRDAHR